MIDYQSNQRLMPSVGHGLLSLTELFAAYAMKARLKKCNPLWNEAISRVPVDSEDLVTADWVCPYTDETLPEGRWVEFDSVAIFRHGVFLCAGSHPTLNHGGDGSMTSLTRARRIAARMKRVKLAFYHTSQAGFYKYCLMTEDSREGKKFWINNDIQFLTAPYWVSYCLNVRWPETSSTYGQSPLTYALTSRSPSGERAASTGLFRHGLAY